MNFKEARRAFAGQQILTKPSEACGVLILDILWVFLHQFHRDLLQTIVFSFVTLEGEFGNAKWLI